MSLNIDETVKNLRKTFRQLMPTTNERDDVMIELILVLADRVKKLELDAFRMSGGNFFVRSGKKEN